MWINQQILLDEAIVPGSLQMHWDDIALFATTLSNNPGLLEQFYQLRGNQVLSFINACGRTLQCYKHKDETNYADQFYSLLKQITKPFNMEDPVFAFCPWLLGEKLPNDAYYLPKASFAVKEQLGLFYNQLKSIDFAKSTYLPTKADLDDAVKQISQSSDSANRRRNIVSELLKKGCVITIQDAPFRKPKAEEAKKAWTFLESNLKPNFKNENIALYKKLIENSLAIKAEGDAEVQLKKLSMILASLDNKSHFNDLGQVLGQLRSAAFSGNKNRCYSVPQLTDWLESLVNEVQDQQHYSFNVLNTVL